MLDQQLVLIQATLQSAIHPARLESTNKPLGKTYKSKYLTQVNYHSLDSPGEGNDPPVKFVGLTEPRLWQPSYRMHGLAFFSHRQLYVLDPNDAHCTPPAGTQSAHPHTLEPTASVT